MSRIPESDYVQLNDGLTLHYQEAGMGDAVLFIHGSGPGASGYSNFKGNYPVFAEAGYRAIVPDLPGYGLSDKPDTEYTLDFFVDAMLGLLGKLSISKVTLVGNSLGGAIAIKMALDHPELVEKLILMAPGGLMPKEQYYQQMEGIQKMGAAFAAGELVEPANMKRLLGLQLFDESQITDDIVNERVAIVLEQPACVLSTMQVSVLTDRLSELQCPILGFWGMNDKFCPVSGVQTMMERCSNIRFNMLSECGHWVMVEHAKLFNRECVDFLKD
ncbi:3-oxoacyl-ACP reductase [Endozoicomonas sp. OPT23]|uniref:alpha/beta fold hydrolase n=1 Tax=Endozoicomonas sp. OPT23 TaxID=2072845 RepID=UPI00129BED89|nr:alpha/beta hydrolase [Endozoicomonas sp. OPT23]MRI33958.1 3-oxoacyl-ACP reductase [Endozoicomonas sp. OPT23]